ncbi:MAG: tRNA epoxyqueuosine(34) reductase QueG [Melioribacteraceae bacterium]|nr:tRNA epoxyqueuosine(34) reductase QueG [Melioribacteraceae bacterium]MCO6474159.1 tRNA epoxyqueuosine(34) reductase QueG [Melioribacteraceae bacterium]MDD3559334.1 tRNA epoxyqueuosine(34) reductase QueG [Melioribacteraceae bacterium]
MEKKITNKIIKQIAEELKFDLVGFAEVKPLKEEIKHLKEWLRKNQQADMKYMERNLEKRENVKEILPGAKSVISLGLNYYSDAEYPEDKNYGKISRYAFGKDYHLIIWDKLKTFEAKLKELDPDIETKSYVDTGPVMDKVWAVKSGIGWMGKHSNVINREIGSWFFIANIFVNRELDYDSPIGDFCGSCTECIDACPTNAIVADYVVDANLCISYHTIENKKEIPKKFTGKFENWLFGCDICQEVCPWNNKFSILSHVKEFNEDRTTRLELSDVMKMDNKEFKSRFADSPLSRTKLKGLKRNAEFLLNESK